MEVAALAQLRSTPTMALGDSDDHKESDLLGIDESENMEMDQNEPILYQGPVFEGEENECLVKPELGFVKGNIKKRVKGFDSEEKIICPLVDRKSAILYDIVQQLEEEQLISTLTVLKSYKKPIVVPRDLFDDENGSDIAVKIVDPEEWKKREEERIMEVELDEQRKVLGNLDYVNETYREPFYHGWTREVVVRIHPAPSGAELGEYQLTSIGEVFYRDPAGNKIRSMKQISISLDKDPVEGLSIKNFTFGKAPIGIRDPKKEIIRKIVSGRHSITVTPNKGAAAKVKKLNSNEIVKSSPSAESPAGIKLKSSSTRRSIQPPKRYATSQTFVYPEKRSKTGTKKDVEYQSDNDMEMGMLPPKYPRGKEDFTGGGTDDSVVRRRGRPPTKKVEPKSAPMSDYNGGNDSALFQISAFHNHSQSSLFDAIDDASQPDDEMYSGMPMLNSRENHRSEETSAEGEEQGSEELLPCSIRCPGMTGEIPTLQCKRCLCLYHPECLALPPNLNFKNFLCANCEGEHVEEIARPSMSSASLSHGGKGSSSTSSTTNAMDAAKKTGWMPKLGESLKVKKPPPPLLPAFPKFGGGKFPGMNSKYKMMPPRMNMMPPPPLGRAFPTLNSNKGTGNKMPSGMSILRPTDDSMSISPITMKRGRGRPPKSSRLLPNLSNRNLTITPISIRPRLPVPNLAPMSKSKTLSLGLMPPKIKGTTVGQQQQHQQKMSTVLPKGRSLLPNLSASTTGPGRLQDTIFREIKEMGRGLKSLQPPVPIVNKGPGGFPPFKRYVQSVVSIGTKKFVAVPRGGSEAPSTLASNKGKVMKKLIPGTKNNSDMTKRSTSQPSSQNSSTTENNNKGVQKAGLKSAHKFDSDQEVIQQVFQYLNVKDLLRASRVCQLWNTVATDGNLWKIVRMKNHRISDVEAFTQFLKRHETEQIDLRKMISAEEMDWNTLFQSLKDVPSLHQIVLGPRTLAADRISILSQHCPNIEILTS